MSNDKEYGKNYRAKNKDKLKEYQKNYFAKRGSTNYELFGRSWYQRNKQKNLERGRKWQRNNRKRAVEIVQAYVGRNKEKVKDYLKKYEQTKPALYRTTKFNAERRGHIFELSFDEFNKITSNKCVYCGESDKRIGIDRINNNKGYTKENSASCCKACNYMKKDLTKEEFLSHVRKICNWNKI